MEQGVERLTAIAMLLTGLSHIAAPRAWRILFERIASSEAAGLANAAIHLPLGLLIVAFHNVWSGPAMIFTIIGWALLMKGALHLLFPRLAQYSLKLPGEGQVAEKRYRLAGAVMTPVAVLLVWLAFA